MFFESWQEILRILITTLIIYPFLIISSHLMGKRSFAKMNNFDWIITIAIGSVLGSAILLKKVVIFEVVIAIITLLVLQYLLTWLSARYTVIDRLVKTSPCIVYYQGKFLHSSMQRERVSQHEIDAAVRKAGFADMSRVTAVIFEPDGELSVIAASQVNDSLVSKLT